MTFTSRKEALREISRNFRETFVMGALEGRYLAGPATWSPHLAGPAYLEPPNGISLPQRDPPPTGLPSELSRRFQEVKARCKSAKNRVRQICTGPE
jgi:hypothetical protein